MMLGARPPSPPYQVEFCQQKLEKTGSLQMANLMNSSGELSFDLSKTLDGYLDTSNAFPTWHHINPKPFSL
jgi:hypothetical protein